MLESDIQSDIIIRKFAQIYYQIKIRIFYAHRRLSYFVVNLKILFEDEFILVLVNYLQPHFQGSEKQRGTIGNRNFSLLRGVKLFYSPKKNF